MCTARSPSTLPALVIATVSPVTTPRRPAGREASDSFAGAAAGRSINMRGETSVGGSSTHRTRTMGDNGAYGSEPDPSAPVFRAFVP